MTLIFLDLSSPLLRPKPREQRKKGRRKKSEEKLVVEGESQQKSGSELEITLPVNPDITVKFSTKKVFFCCEGADYRGTIENIVSSGFGGNIGTAQKKAAAGYNKVKHQHVYGDIAIAFRWENNSTLLICAIGKKSNSAIRGTGGYNWTVRPK